MKLFLATKNHDKIREIENILSYLPINIYTMNDLPDIPEVIEDKNTLEGNASKKALETARNVNMFTVSDDTGLFVDALDGEPGVKSARFAGEKCTYNDNRVKLLKVMTKKNNRTAYFRTVVAFASPEKIIKTFYGEVKGEITDKELGINGFGYDSIFKVDSTGKTYAQMSDEEKNIISHRSLALENFSEYLRDYLKEKE